MACDARRVMHGVWCSSSEGAGTGRSDVPVQRANKGMKHQALLALGEEGEAHRLRQPLDVKTMRRKERTRDEAKGELYEHTVNRRSDICIVVCLQKFFLKSEYCIRAVCCSDLF